MSGGPPPYYGFTGGGNPYYPTGAPPQMSNIPPMNFASAPYPQAPVQSNTGPPSYFYAPQHFPITNTYPSGVTHFTNTSVHQSGTSFTQVKSPTWIHWNKGNTLPADAVEAGYDIDGTKIYVGRIYHHGDLIPAKVIPQKKVAYVPYGGKEVAFTACEILCHNNVRWAKSSHGQVPAGALLVGQTATRENLYVGRVHHKGSLTIGKVHPSHKVCYIPFDGKEVAHHDYEILIA